MKYIKIITLVITSFLVTSCSSIKVMSDYNKETSFDQYKTFKLLQHDNDFPLGFNPINKARLEKAVVKKMTQLGYKNSDKADLLITFFVKKDMKHSKSVTDYYDEYEYVQRFDAYDYTVGTLVVDIIDAKKKQIVWHGILNRTTDENIKTAEKRINENIDRVFKLFEQETQLH